MLFNFDFLAIVLLKILQVQVHLMLFFIINYVFNPCKALVVVHLEYGYFVLRLFVFLDITL